MFKLHCGYCSKEYNARNKDKIHCNKTHCVEQFNKNNPLKYDSETGRDISGLDLRPLEE